MKLSVRLCCCVLVFGFVFLSVGTVAAAVIEVTNAYDSGEGSFRQAISDANSSGEADTIIFTPGLATVTLFLLTELPTLPSDLTIDGTYAPLIDGSSVSGPIHGGQDYAGFYIEDQDNITISGLRISGFRYGVVIWDGASNITIEGCTLTSIHAVGEHAYCILFHPRSGEVSQNLAFINNTIENAGIAIHSLGPSTVQGLTISGNACTDAPIEINLANTADYIAIVDNVMISDNVLNGDGIQVLANHPGTTSNHCTISNVTIKDNVVEGDSISVDIASGTENHISGLLIKNNRITRDDGEGIRLANDADRASNSITTVIENNIVVNCGAEGIQVQGGIEASIVNNLSAGNRQGMGLYAGPTVLAVNNLVTKNVYGINVELVYDSGFSTENIQLFNNMIVNNCLYGIAPDSPLDPRPLLLFLAYNNFWGNGTDYGNVTPGVSDIAVDPLFVDADAGDYHLSDGSPCIDAGYPDLAYGDTGIGEGGPRADIGLYGGPGAVEFEFSTPAVDYQAGIFYVEAENNRLSAVIANEWGAEYALHLMVGASPCTVDWVKAISPISQEYVLFDDGSNGDILPGDGQFETTLFSASHPIPGTWRFELMSLQGELFQTTIDVMVNNLTQPVLVYPVGGAPIPETLTTALWWSFVPDTVEGYRILVYDGLPATFGIEGLVYMDEVDSQTNSTTIPAGFLKPGKEYHWVVQSFYEQDSETGDSVIASLHADSFTTPSIVIADFWPSPDSGGIPLTVSFADTSQGPVETWSWDFGDGSPLSSEQNPSHTYSAEGQYQVRLTVATTEGGGDTDYVEKTIDAHVISAEISNPPDNLTNATAYTVFVEGQDVVAYRYRVDGGDWSEPFFVDAPISFSVVGEGAHTLEVVGRDQAGTWQSESSPTQEAWMVDTTLPDISILTPDNNAIYDVNEISTIEAIASDVNGIDHVEFQITDRGIYYLTYPTGQIDSAVWIPAGTLSGYPNTWWVDSTNFSWTLGKDYTLTARAIDSAGNMATDAILVTVHDTGSSLAWTNLSLSLSSQSIQAGETIVVSGKLARLPVGDPPVSMVGQTITLTVTDSQGTPVFTTDTATADAQGNYSFDSLPSVDEAGLYYLNTSFAGSGTLYQSVSETRLLVVGGHPGYAIIVQGKILAEEGLDAHNKTVTRIYDRLIDRGLGDDDIFYFNYAYDPLDLTSVIDAAPTKTEVRSAIETWAANKMNDIPAPLYLILVDHGNRDAFYIGDQTISPADLNTWLNTLEGRLDAEAIEEKRCAIIGACYSGSFIPKVSKAGRVVVTSAAQDEESFKGPLEPDTVRSGEFFVEEFFHDLWLGRSFRNAFGNAVVRTEVYTRRGDSQANTSNPYFDSAIQHPLLDDNGDGAGSNVLSVGTGDGQVADDLYLGVGSTQDSGPVDISGVTATLYLDHSTSSATLWAEANGSGATWMEVRRPPLTLDNEGGTGQLVVPSERHTMAYDSLRYENADVVFDESGKYEVFYFHYEGDAETNAISSLKRSLVYKGKDGNSAPDTFSLLLPADGSTQKTMLVFDWEDAVDPDPGNAVTYTLTVAEDAGFSNVVFMREEIPISFTFVDLSAGLQDATTYFWKVEAVDPFGAQTVSAQEWSFATNNTNAFSGYVTGTVYNRLNNEPLSGARVGASLGGAYAYSMDNGFYLMIVPAGIATLASAIEGFEDSTLTGVRIPEAGILEVNIGMLPSGAAADSLAPVSTASLPAGSYDEGQTVVLTCTDPGGSGCGQIFYTIDGSEPTSGAHVYTAPILICQNTTLKFYAKDAAGNDEPVHTLVYEVTAGQSAGSVDGDCVVELADAILALQVIAGINPGTTVSLQADVNGDEVIGLAEVVFILQKEAQLRN